MEVVNGLLGVGRNVILKLFFLFWFMEDGIKQIFGMCGEFYPWKKHLFFLKGRPEKIPAVFCVNKFGAKSFTLTHESSCERCRFADCFERKIFLDYVVSDGVFQWTLKIDYTKTWASRFRIGTTSDDSDKAFHEKATCPCFMFWKESKTKYRSRLLFHLNKELWNENTPIVPDGSLVTMEVNATTMRVRFFIDDRRRISVPPEVVISGPQYLWISGTQFAAITSVYFFRLSAC